AAPLVRGPTAGRAVEPACQGLTARRSAASRPSGPRGVRLVPLPAIHAGFWPAITRRQRPPLALTKAAQPCCGRVRPLAWCSRPRNSAALPEGALVSAAPRGDSRQGFRKDRDVEPDRPVLDVVEVEPDEVVEAQVDPAGHLPETRHSREHEVALPVPLLQLLVVANG